MPHLLHRSRIGLFASLVCGGFYIFGSNEHSLHPRVRPEQVVYAGRNVVVEEPVIVIEQKESWDSSVFVNGPPGKSFRENMRNDTAYVTSWTDGGFTNQFMTYANLIYLGVISGRVPVLPPFAPFDHQKQNAGIIPFGEIFDLKALRAQLRRPVLEWHDLKNTPASHTKDDIEPMGCWSTWMAVSDDGRTPRPAQILVDHLGLDPSYSTVPQDTRREKKDWEVMFWALAALIYPGKRIHSDSNPIAHLESASTKSTTLGLSLVPDEHMACFDFLYFVTATRQPLEWEHSWSPAWNVVGTHLRYAPALIDIGSHYVRKLWNLQTNEAIPQFIAVHIRRGDFGRDCKKRQQIPLVDVIDECFVPFQEYIKAIQQVQEDLLLRGISVPNAHVVVTSDENSPVFWDRVVLQGYSYVDHAFERTVERHGDWHPILIDGVIQSMAAGFVGTDSSTVSLLSDRRVNEWNGGVTRTVRRI